MAQDRHPHLDTLVQKHRDLHAQVDAESARPRPDQVRLTALKKAKLQAKEQIHAFSTTLPSDAHINA